VFDGLLRFRSRPLPPEAAPAAEDPWGRPYVDVADVEALASFVRSRGPSAGA